VPDLVQHVVFTLADSLPSRIREEIGKIPPLEQVHAIDASLDQGYGRQDLVIPEIARLIQRALFQFDDERYSLLAGA
jgi:hypothetical protein